NFVRLMMQKYPDYNVVNLDKLTYAGHRENLADIENDSRYQFIHGDITNPDDVQKAMQGVDYVVHFAAESHVDRSIENSAVFVETNVVGTHYLLEQARQQGVEKFVHVSTDEVYGTLGETGFFTETTPLAPNSPYSASKAGSDLLARAYYETYGFPAVITRCSNNYGPYQFPEKLIPLMIHNALKDINLPVYGDGKNVRDWLHVQDHCTALDVVLHKGKAGEVYNIGGNNEWYNIDIVKLILKELGKPESLITFVTDRLGHDRRYAIDSGKIQRELGWSPQTQFEDGIKTTIQWYQEQTNWVEAVLEKGKAGE
ncbi:MAG: dTDP-glucose 4,6-dehydratase, partial [Candidatus Omnitrophica bacterium]|nr:dTDP-glucose 4,6-dehydratase [Candidatus Omnitrophota bacterium]